MQQAPIKNEEEIISNIHLKLKKNLKNLLTIIIPRHVERSREILETIHEKNLNYICHSEKKIKKDTDIYLVDTYGESKNFYSISKVVYLGGSFIPKGGQNPLEPLRSGCYITHGKYTFNFKEIYRMLDKNCHSRLKIFYTLKKIIQNLLTRKSNNIKEVNKFKKIGNNILKKILKK